MKNISIFGFIVALAIGQILTAVSIANESAEISEKEIALEDYALNQEDYTAWIVGIGSFSLDSKNASEQGIGSSANYIKLGWEGQTGALVYGLGIDGLLLSDKAGFSVVVEDNFGDVSTAKSSAEAFGLYGELGYAMPFGNNGNFELLGGFDILSAERSVTNCTNCPSDNISLDGGLYIEPRVRFFNESGFMFSLSYRKYMSEDIDGGLFLGFSWRS